MDRGTEVSNQSIAALELVRSHLAIILVAGRLRYYIGPLNKVHL